MDNQEHTATLTAELNAVKAQLRAAKREIEEIHCSKTWKLGTALRRLIRLPLALIGRNIAGGATIQVTSWLPFISGTVTFDGSDVKSVHLVLEIEHSDVTEQTVYRSSGGSSNFKIKFPIDTGIPSLSAVQLRASSGQRLSPPPALYDSVPSQLERACQTLDRQDVEAFDLSKFEDEHVALLSTFRPLGRGVQPLLVYVRALQQNGLKVIIIDTTEDLPKGDETTLRSIADHYLRRENTGWDFSSWLSVVSIFPDLEAVAKRIFLLNDSNIGPLYDLSPLIQPHHLAQTNDVWGITESLQVSRHLQSYFLAFEEPALKAKVLSRFAKHYTFPSMKDEIIAEGEVALTQFLISDSLRVGALISYTDVTQRFAQGVHEKIDLLRKSDIQSGSESLNNLRTSDYEVAWIFNILNQVHQHSFLNPTHTFWKEIYEMGSPFIKRELLTKNPTSVPNLSLAMAETFSQESLRLVMSELTFSTKTVE